MGFSDKDPHRLRQTDFDFYNTHCPAGCALVPRTASP